MAERLCQWIHERRWYLLVVWTLHAFLLHLLVLGYPSWDGIGYRTAPMVELIQHGSLGADKFLDYAFSGYIPFLELAHVPFVLVFGLPGFMIGFPLVVFPLCVCAVYGFGRELTGDPRCGTFAALAYAAMPMFNSEPFAGYVDFAICGALAFYLYAVLRLRTARPGWRSFTVVALASFIFTMSRAQALYVVVLLLPVVGYAGFCERDGWRIRFTRRRELAIAVAATLVGALPTIGIQIAKFIEYGTPTFPLQFQVFGLKLGRGLTLRDYMVYAGLADDSRGEQARAFFRGWIWHPHWPMGSFFDSRFMGAGLVPWIALATLPVWVRRSTRLERWVVPTFVAVSLLAHDFVHPRWAYTLALAWVVLVARTVPALAAGARLARIACLAGTVTLLLHLLRPEIDILQYRTGEYVGPRLNISDWRYFMRSPLGFRPYPDRNAHFVIVQYTHSGFLLHLYGKRLTNEVLGTIPKTELGEHCEGLAARLAAAPAGSLFVDDWNFTEKCERICVIRDRESPECRAYRLGPA